jgi:hypothetical protein
LFVGRGTTASSLYSTPSYQSAVAF